jgi:hypothetical protein
MGIFDRVSEEQVKEAKYFERGNYVKPGRYLVEVLKVKEGTMRPPKSIGFFVVEMKVHETSDAKEHPLRSTMTWMSTADKDAFLGNVKHFIASAGNVTEDEVGIEMCKYAVSEENPLAGIYLQVDAVAIKTKADKDFTKVKFTYIGEAPAKAAAAAQASA